MRNSDSYTLRSDSPNVVSLGRRIVIPSASIGTVAALLVVALLGFGYWPLAVGLGITLFGLVAVLLASIQLRLHPIWAAIVAFLLGFAMIAPFGCTSTQNGVEVTECQSSIGLSLPGYKGHNDFSPTYWPAVGGGVLAGGGVWFLMQRKRSRASKMATGKAEAEHGGGVQK
jgi:hypothetical protein